MAPGQPKEEQKPQPIGYMPMVILFTTCMLCALFLLWRRADSFRRVVSHQLKTFTRRGDGEIRLSEDDGPPAREFLEDDYDDDNEALPGDNSDDEPLGHHVRPNVQTTGVTGPENVVDARSGARQGHS
ncbi:hypothetical protein D9756_008048 [Leucocoprinus leucothites]|uniref:Uncharacterized protein n=1 Tax=Leucocoprinus leucothites TaxID=201217 RepID=A0A8H5D6Z2_9AGAR|nr:hypothetical protein D9756_008048 [Leucoagaricus leucothites]